MDSASSAPVSSAKPGHSGKAETARQILTGRSEKSGLARLLPGATSALLAMKHDELHKYLQHHLDVLHAKGFSATAEVMRGDPAGAIVNAAHRIKADLVVLATHRKKGLNALWAGSVAPKVSSHYYRLLLLVPLG